MVTWDFADPVARRRGRLRRPVDFSETGKVMADMALKISAYAGGNSQSFRPRPDAATRTLINGVPRVAEEGSEVRRSSRKSSRLPATTIGGELQSGSCLVDKQYPT